MGLKNFLKQQGFITEEGNQETTAENNNSIKAKDNPPPVYFPIHPSLGDAAAAYSAAQHAVEPSFVTPVKHESDPHEELDPTFVKFFEDELAKANLPGPDYFEFRQLLNTTQQKMAAKGVAASELILQTVLINFETQDISPSKLVEAARQYKIILKQKNDDFLNGAATEKTNQLQKRQQAVQAHDANMKKIQQQLQQLEQQKKQLEESLNKEKTGQELNKTLGREGIEKIEKAERLISLAHNYIQSAIDNDIAKLQSL